MRSLIKGWICLPVLLLMMVAFTACHRPNQTAASLGGNRTFEVRGILHGIDPKEKSITVEHEDIPGFMPAMTMPFYYKEEAEVKELPIGSVIAFSFVVADEDSWVTNVRVLKSEAGKEVQKQTRPAPKGARIREGDRIPEFRLVDQDNQLVTREDLKGKATLLTFIFTRCPVPNFCPLMSSRFSQLQNRISDNAAVKEKVRLLSISFDPQDTPEVLSLYARNHSADTQLWTHAGGSDEEVKKLTDAFSVYILQESGTYSHGLCSALIDENGKVAKIWRGNDWSVDEVWQELETSLQ